MATLFDEVKLGELALPNRVVMAPMTRSRADRAGVPIELTASYYAQRASAGLIVTEGIQPAAVGQGYVYTPGLHDDAQVAGWRRVTDAVHQAGGRIFSQFMHTGRIGHPDLIEGQLPIAPSAVRAAGQAFTYGGMRDYVEPRALDESELPGVVADFVAAAKNSIRAGFDGVELHGANGYLLQQFLSDSTNKRTDRYGGSVENRIRFVVEVVTAVAEAIGPERLGLRISPAGTFNDIAESDPEQVYPALVRAIAPLGLAYLHISESDREITRTLRELWPSTLILKPDTGDAAVDQAAAEQALAEGVADLIAFGRHFLANPDLPHRLRTGGALNEFDPTTFYNGVDPDTATEAVARGYTDYPALSAV